MYNHFSVIKPGLYQVRVAARDAKEGRSGSGFQWIEIPDLESKTLALSTLIVAERRVGTDGAPGMDPTKPFDQVRLNIDHHFSRTSHLRFLTFVYNASGGKPVAPTPAPSDSSPGDAAMIPTSANVGAPDLAVQVQVFRDNEPVITDPSAQGFGRRHRRSQSGSLRRRADARQPATGPIRFASDRNRSHRQDERVSAIHLSKLTEMVRPE